MAHFLKNRMKRFINACDLGSILQFVATDFRAMKKIAEDANHERWNQSLPDAFELIQEAETRFSTNYIVVKKFLKTASKVLTDVQTRNRSILFAFLTERRRNLNETTTFQASLL